MAVTIPLRNDVPDYDFQVELDGQTYGIRMLWNFRSEQWTLSLFNSLGEPLALNVGFVVDFPLARRIQTEGMPPGVFIAKDTSGQHREPAFADLGGRVQLVYLSASEIPE